MEIMIISVAHFASDEIIRNELLKYDAIRATTLKLITKVPGYGDMTLAEKNKLYDETRKGL